VTDPQSFNGYTYVRNRPLSFIDPLGTFCGYYQQTKNTVDTIEFDDYESSPRECSDSSGTWIDENCLACNPQNDPFGNGGSDPMSPDDSLTPFARAVSTQVWNQIGFIAQPTCPGTEGAYAYIGPNFKIPKTPIRASILGAAAWDGKSGLQLGGFAEVGRNTSLKKGQGTYVPFNAGVEGFYSFKEKKTTFDAIGFLSPRGAKAGPGKAGAMFGGDGTVGPNLDFGFFGFGAYAKPSFLGKNSCK
jgi:hypothetical protein